MPQIYLRLDFFHQISMYSRDLAQQNKEDDQTCLLPPNSRKEQK